MKLSAKTKIKWIGLRETMLRYTYCLKSVAIGFPFAAYKFKTSP